jgi:succinate dehydrogenase / fumarate reductase cytochrome b subunit
MAKSELLNQYKKKLQWLFQDFLMFFSTAFFYQYDFGFSADTFNSISHFMGNNPLVQFVIQPILIVGVIFHFIMGFVLDFKNRCKTNQIHKE